MRPHLKRASLKRERRQSRNRRRSFSRRFEQMVTAAERSVAIAVRAVDEAVRWIEEQSRGPADSARLFESDPLRDIPAWAAFDFPVHLPPPSPPVSRFHELPGGGYEHTITWTAPAAAFILPGSL